MMEWIVAAVVVAASILALLQIMRDPSRSPAERKRSLMAIVYYTLYIAFGVVLIMFAPLDRLTGPSLLALVAGVFAWTTLGALWILRTTPSGRPPPAYLLKRWSALDFALIAVIVLSIILVLALS